MVVPFSVIIVSVLFLTPAIVGLLSDSARLPRQLLERGLGSGMPKRAIKESSIEELSETTDCVGVTATTRGLGAEALAGVASHEPLPGVGGTGIPGKGSFGGGLGGSGNSLRSSRLPIERGVRLGGSKDWARRCPCRLSMHWDLGGLKDWTRKCPCRLSKDDVGGR
jgi:hypothetical protein